jgi:hypothetical protein
MAEVVALGYNMLHITHAGRGGRVGRALGVMFGLGLGVCGSDGVGVGLGGTVAVDVAVAVGVGLGGTVAVAVAVALGVGVGVVA